jgi:hypothetical protein
MSGPAWPVITCTACGATGPGRRAAGLCKRCYARAQHPVLPCADCGQVRRHFAAGLCARCYRLSRTRLVVCPGCGQQRPVFFSDRCQRCKRRAAARAGTCRDCGKEVTRLWSGRCRTCDHRVRETTGACADCGDLARLTSGLCKACRHFRWPATANPHLLINQATAGGLQPVSRSYVQAAMRRAGITAQQLRAARLLGEAEASGGDPLQLTHLFGISDPTAIRYCTELNDATAPGSPGQRLT